LEIPLDVAESAEEALESADVLITATNAPTPVLTASA
jgi:ornithine cyclodeaminase/alanine dehydrogenase-like protein (mu-crystallin family)